MKKFDFIEKNYQKLFKKLLSHRETADYIYNLPTELAQIKQQWQQIPRLQNIIKQLSRVEELNIDLNPVVSVQRKEINDNQNLVNYLNDLQLLANMFDPILFDQADFLTISSTSLACDDQHAISARLSFLAGELKPWRKGPYQLYGLEIDAEWRSDLKWQLITPNINLLGKSILDIGSSNGYHLWCYKNAGARLVVGVEPYWLFVMQHWLIDSLLANHPWQQDLLFIPTKLEGLAQNKSFDFVSSMGVLYHYKDAIEHLKNIRNCLNNSSSQLFDNAVILETIVQNSQGKHTCYPLTTYANMPNVYAIPSLSQLEDWLKIAGFQQWKVISYRKATVIEQRTTEWIDDQSFATALDPNNPQLTIEGLPAPYRVIILAK